MLQQLSYQDQAPYEPQAEQFLTPEYFYDVIKRRLLYFIIPFVLIFAIGAVVTAMLPATYVSEGKMLIESQEIPTNLVQPTVSTFADERVALLQQRIMVRDKLLAIANKYKLPELAQSDLFFGRWLPQMSATDIVEMMRARTQIIPLANELQPGQRRFIAFTVSFENERPQIAVQVANELTTIILNEDVRARTSSASETTRFLDREEKRLQTELDSLEIKIADAKNREVRAPMSAAGAAGAATTPENQLIMLRTELAMKAATYSDTHPDMKALKVRIATLDKLLGKKTNDATSKTNVATGNANDATGKANDTPVDAGIDALERQRISTRKDLDGISQKLAVARLGESLERGQHSERLSVIEQPTLPQKPARPNRPKILAIVFAMAIAAGGGLVFALEMFDGTIRRNADIAKLIDGHLIVSIPYISTKAETRRQKSRKITLAFGSSMVVVLLGLGAAIYLLRKFGLF
jgi:uncharacterized protein involved in exopolysaccharide biosynthesis